MITRSKVVIYKPKVYIVVVQLEFVDEALQNENWVATMRGKYLALMRNGTWSLWVFKIKENPDDTVNKYKPRQVGKGFYQVVSFDFNETALQYVTITRLEIAFKVNKVCRFMQRPLASHRKAMKRILRLQILLIENQPQESDAKEAQVRHVQSQDQIADVLIKAISSYNFPALRHKRSELRISAL
ncbi:hypothetical protein AAG906_015989 [Vitis piasezkii]